MQMPTGQNKSSARSCYVVAKKVIMIAGGGTGGHVYPGIAIARALEKKDSNIEIHFVGTKEGLETKIIPREKFPLHLIFGGKLNFAGNPLLKIKTLIKLPLGFLQSAKLILKYKPVLVLGVGGYASGPFVLTAALLGYKTAIWEPNALPGMANRLLSRFVKKCFVVFEESKSLLNNSNVIVAGMPIRAEIEILSKPQGAKSEFHILHYGGSQGSRIIGRTLCAAIQSKELWPQGIRVVHQTGSIDHADFISRYAGFENQVEIQEFIFDMPKYYQWADLVICRGGASTLNEIAAFGLPAIVIPLPAADGHQEKNAEILVSAGAARMILQKDLSKERLIEEINFLRNNEAVRKGLADNVRKFYKAKASETIAESLLSF